MTPTCNDKVPFTNSKKQGVYGPLFPMADEELPPFDGQRLLKAPDYRLGASMDEDAEDEMRVPEWFYHPDQDVCGMTKAAFIWWSNVICACLHFFLAVTTIAVAMSGGKGMDTPKLTVYLTNLTWQANSTDALIPKNQPQDGLALAWMTLWFFLLSFFAHTTIVIGNYTQAMALANKKKRRITRLTGWYYVWIQDCRQPLRWFECALPARPHTSPS